MILISILIQAAAGQAAIDVYRERTRAAVACHATTDSADVVVCGRREADRYRVPFIVYDAGDPRHMGVPEERARLIRDQSPCEARGPFLVGCGAAGITASVGGGGSSVGGGMRALAP